MDLPKEILTEILVKLPVKSLLRFSCVSKTWCALIGSHYFSTKHLNQNKDDHRVAVAIRHHRAENCYQAVFLHDSHSEDDGSLQVVAQFNLELPNLGNPQLSSIQLHGACNGLVCLSGPYSLVYLCNLSTRECFQLPPGVLDLFYCESNWDQRLGLGFDPCVKDYKIIRIVRLHIERRFEAEIYQLGANFWRKLDVDLSFVRRLDPLNIGVLTNGSFHWCARSSSNQTCHFILAFDIHDETFREIKCPHPEARSLALAVLDDSLASITTTYDTVDIWVMMNYGINESWTKKYSFEYGVGYRDHLSFWKSDKLLLKRDGYFAFCAFENCPQEEVQKFATPHRYKQLVTMYQESLVSPKRMVECNSKLDELGG